MMITPLPAKEIEARDYLPQAVFGLSISYCASLLRAKLTHGEDDLDEYEGAAFLLDKEFPFTLKHYKGHPKDTTTLYLSHELRDLTKISEIILRIMYEAGLERRALAWQRSDDPDL